MDFEADDNRIINEIDADFLTEQELENGEQLMPMIDEVIFLVHITDDLLDVTEEGDSPFRVIINSYISFVKSKIVCQTW